MQINGLKTMLHLVPSFHYDVIYLRSCAEYLDIGCNIIGQALDILGRNTDYTFTIEQIFLVEEFCRRSPGRIGELRRFANEGRLEFAPGMYVMPDMNFCDGEAMYQQVKYGRKFLTDVLGLDENALPQSCWIADCWGHHAQLPQILTQCGYRSYFFMRCMRPDVLKRDFVWEGIDGSRLPVSWLAASYSGLHFSGECENRLELDFAGVTPEEVNRVAAKLRSFGDDGDLLLPNGGDNCLPQEIACEIVPMLNASGVLTAPLAFSTPAKYASCVNWQDKTVVKGEFCGYSEGSYTTNVQVKQRVLAASRRLRALEILHAVSGKTQGHFDECWKILLKQQFHDIIMGTICDDGLREVRSDLNDLEQRLDTLAGTPIGVFNPLPKHRHCEVTLPDGRLLTTTMAPLEYLPIEACRTQREPDIPVSLPMTFYGDGYKCEIGQDGFVHSLQSADGVELANQHGPCPFGALTLQIDRGDSWCNFNAPLHGGCDASYRASVTPDPYERVAPGPLIVASTIPCCIQQATAQRSNDGRVRITQRGCIQFWRLKADFTITLTLDESSPLLSYRVEFLPSGKDFRIRAVFPLSFSNGRLVHSIPFGLQERPRAERPCSGLLHFSNDSASAALLTRGIAAGNVDDDGNMMITLFRSIAMEYKCESALSYNSGIPHLFEYAIVPGRNVEQTVALADDYHHPAILCDAGTEHLSPAFPELPDNVRLASARRLQDGRCFVRLVECAGKSCDVVLPAQAEYADAMEYPTGNAVIGTQLRMNPFQILNLLLPGNYA